MNDNIDVDSTIASVLLMPLDNVILWKVKTVMVINYTNINKMSNHHKGSSWSWSYGSWIYDYLCNQCHSPLTWVWIPLMTRCMFDTTLCDQVWVLRFPPPIKLTNNITEILLKVVLNTNQPYSKDIFVSTLHQWIIFYVWSVERNKKTKKYNPNKTIWVNIWNRFNRNSPNWN
jgi:hypothetical protein